MLHLQTLDTPRHPGCAPGNSRRYSRRHVTDGYENAAQWLQHRSLLQSPDDMLGSVPQLRPRFQDRANHLRGVILAKIER